MSTDATNKIPTWFWVVSGIALLWNLVGVAAYIMQVTMTPEAMAALPEAQRIAYENTPGWATGAFAIAVFAGALGSLALLLRKSWAVPVLLLSLGGALVQNVHNFFMSNNIEIMGSEAIVMPALVIAIGVALVWFARKSQANGWIS